MNVGQMCQTLRWENTPCSRGLFQNIAYKIAIAQFSNDITLFDIDDNNFPDMKNPLELVNVEIHVLRHGIVAGACARGRSFHRVLGREGGAGSFIPPPRLCMIRDARIRPDAWQRMSVWRFDRTRSSNAANGLVKNLATHSS